jgi:RNA recognition motif-containing protein
LTFKGAHVVIKKNGRSKGFGFIEFENEGDQQKALNALNNKEVDGRALVVKVALTESPVCYFFMNFLFAHFLFLETRRRKTRRSPCSKRCSQTRKEVNMIIHYVYML